MPWMPWVGLDSAIQIEPTGPLGPGGIFRIRLLSPCLKLTFGIVGVFRIEGDARDLVGEARRRRVGRADGRG